jgi:hypothetical protein
VNMSPINIDPGLISKLIEQSLSLRGSIGRVPKHQVNRAGLTRAERKSRRRTSEGSRRRNRG